MFDFLNNFIGEAFAFGITKTTEMIQAPNGLDQIGQANGWFIDQYGLMTGIALWLLAPLALVAIIQSIAKGSMEMLLKATLVYPALAFLGTIIAVRVVELMIGVVDAFCEVFLNAVRDDVDDFVEETIASTSGLAQEDAQGALVAFLGIFGIAATLMTIVMLIIRDASIFLATSFLPIGFAMLVWPATAKWLRRMVEFLIAMIFSKLVMVAAIALAVSAFSGAVGAGTAGGEALGLNGTSVAAPAAAGAAGASANTEGSFQAIFTFMSAIALFCFTAFAPALTSRMIGNLGLDGAADAFSGAMTRPNMVKPMVFGKRAQGIYGNLKGAANAGKEKKQLEAFESNRSWATAMLAGRGHDPTDHGYAVGAVALTELRRMGKDELADYIMQKSRSDNANEVFRAHEMLAIARTLEKNDDVVLERGANGQIDGLSVDHSGADGSRTRTTHKIMDIVNPNTGQPIDRYSSTHIDRIFQQERAKQELHQQQNSGSDIQYRTTLRTGLMPEHHKGTQAGVDNRVNSFNRANPSKFRATAEHGIDQRANSRQKPTNSLPPVDGS
jgi:hypothetical protein